jgi:hypothetical protein
VVEYKAGQLPSESLQSLLIRISIVAHGHGNQVLDCLGTFSAWATNFFSLVEVCVTLNIPEPALERSIREAKWPFRISVTVNSKPLGFGSNHNQALRDSDAAWFMIVNPDVRFRPAEGHSGFSPVWLENMQANVGLVWPVQLDHHGASSDCARPLPTPRRVLVRFLRRLFHVRASTHAAEPIDWVNGACAIVRSQAFRQIGGFDERYFMYCEDVDLCLRLQLAGWHLVEAPFSVVHPGQRESQRRFWLFCCHIRSLMRLWTSRFYWRYVFRSWVASLAKQ